MTDVKVTQNEAGDYFVGFEADGTFVSFASVSANRVAQLQERHHDLEAKLEAGDAAAAEAVQSLPVSASAPKKTGESKGGAS